MSCVTKMLPETEDGPASLELDACSRCQMFWFDPGEFEGMPPSIPDQVDTPEVSTKDLPKAARMALMHARLRSIEEHADLGQKAPDNLIEMVAGALLLPLELDEDAPSRLNMSWVTAALGLLVVVLSATLGFYQDSHSAAAPLVVMSDDPWRFGGMNLLTATFIHTGWIHFLGNLYFLITFGDNVEDVLGKARFLLLWLAATVGSFALSVLFSGPGASHYAGADAGISAIIILYLFLFPRVKLGLLFFWQWTIRFPAWVLGGVWLALQVLLSGSTADIVLNPETHTVGEFQLSGAGLVGTGLGAVVGLVAFLVWRNRVR